MPLSSSICNLLGTGLETVIQSSYLTLWVCTLVLLACWFCEDYCAELCAGRLLGGVCEDRIVLQHWKPIGVSMLQFNSYLAVLKVWLSCHGLGMDPRTLKTENDVKQVRSCSSEDWWTNSASTFKTQVQIDRNDSLRCNHPAMFLFCCLVRKGIMKITLNTNTKFHTARSKVSPKLTSWVQMDCTLTLQGHSKAYVFHVSPSIKRVLGLLPHPSDWNQVPRVWSKQINEIKRT